MTRWKVKRYKDFDGFCWVAHPEDWSLYKAFDTHPEALAYADRKAGTVEVVLPLSTKSVTLGPNAWAELRPDGGVTMHGPTSSIGVRKAHMEAVALALLAHARRNQ